MALQALRLVLQLLVTESMRPIGTDPLPLASILLVRLKVALADMDIPISLEGDDMGRQPIEKPAIVRDHHH